MGIGVAVASLQDMGLTLDDAKIALRAAVFMLEEIYRRPHETREQLEKQSAALSPELYKFIKSKIEATRK